MSTTTAPLTAEDLARLKADCHTTINMQLTYPSLRFQSPIDAQQGLALISQVETLTAERDEARLSVSASDAANQIGGLVGASAHDLHIEMERRLAERAAKEKARADTLAVENERLRKVVAMYETASLQGWRADVLRERLAALAAGEPG